MKFIKEILCKIQGCPSPRITPASRGEGVTCAAGGWKGDGEA